MFLRLFGRALIFGSDQLYYVAAINLSQQAKRNTIRSGDRDNQSGGGPDCLLSVLILFMGADAVISSAVAMHGDARQEA